MIDIFKARVREWDMGLQKKESKLLNQVYIAIISILN